MIIMSCSVAATGIEDVKHLKKVYLSEAIEAALKNNIDLQATRLEIDIAKNNIKTANRLKNPSFDAFYFIGAAGRTEPRQLGVSEKIELLKRSARKNLALSNYALAENNVNYTKFDLKMDVREAYINLVAEKSILDTLEQQKELQEELLEIARQRTLQNKAPEIDALQAEISLNQLITQVNSAKLNVNTALAYFNKIINDPNEISYDTEDKLFSEENNFAEMLTPAPTENFPSADVIIKKAMQNRYDIKIAKQEIDIAEKNLTLISRQRIPDISISGGYAYRPGAYSETGNFNNGAYAGASLVNIPLFYNYSPEIKNAAYKVEQAELKYKSVCNKALKDINSAYERFLTAGENLNHYEKKILKNSEKMINMSMDSYELGKYDITSLIVMKQAYKSIILGYTYALSEYYNSWTNFLRETNDENFELLDNL